MLQMRDMNVTYRPVSRDRADSNPPAEGEGSLVSGRVYGERTRAEALDGLLSERSVDELAAGKLEVIVRDGPEGM
jgi:hypothetical protein